MKNEKNMKKKKNRKNPTINLTSFRVPSFACLPWEWCEERSGSACKDNCLHDQVFDHHQLRKRTFFPKKKDM